MNFEIDEYGFEVVEIDEYDAEVYSLKPGWYWHDRDGNPIGPFESYEHAMENGGAL